MFSELVRYALDSASTDFGEKPIRVLSELDVVAFIRASGQELLYAYYDPATIGRFLPINVGLWDPQVKRERFLRFDYLDSRMRIVHADPNSEFPAYRYGAALSFLQSLGKTPGSWASEGLQLQRALEGDSPATRIAQLESAAFDGNFSAATAYANACVMAKLPDCAPKMVDMLLPYAEKSYAMALIMLAIAYDSGIGVKRNVDNARKLLDAADRRLGDGKGSIRFIAMSLLRSGAKGEMSALAGKSAETFAEQRKPFAELLATAIAYRDRIGKPLDDKHLAYLRDAAQADLFPAQSMLGAYLLENGNKVDGLRWTERAAEQGDPDSQYRLAQAYEAGVDKQKNTELARKWYAEAGAGGNLSAMLWMARYYAQQPVSAKTRLGRAGWLESAMDKGSVDAALELAALYQSGGDGVSGGEKEAIAIYRFLDKRKDNAEARRRLAETLVTSKAIDHDPVEARRLLQKDVDRGDSQSRVILGLLLARGDFGKDQIETGRTLLERAAKEGDIGAMVEYGNALYNGEEPRRKDALVYWQRAADKGDRTAINNLAWAYCTSSEPEILDAKRGVELAEKLIGDAAPTGHLDTVAACLASAGDFDRAVAMERGVLQKAEAQNAGREDSRFIKNLRERVDLYSRHQVYREPAKESN